MSAIFRTITNEITGKLTLRNAKVFSFQVASPCGAEPRREFCLGTWLFFTRSAFSLSLTVSGSARGSGSCRDSRASNHCIIVQTDKLLRANDVYRTIDVWYVACKLHGDRAGRADRCRTVPTVYRPIGYAEQIIARNGDGVRLRSLQQPRPTHPTS